jgi:hypothetical protein
MTGCSILDIGTSINRIETISSSDFARVLDPYRVSAARGTECSRLVDLLAPIADQVQ